MSILLGERILFKSRTHDFLNIGAICLTKNQKKIFKLFSFINDSLAIYASK